MEVGERKKYEKRGKLREREGDRCKERGRWEEKEKKKEVRREKGNERRGSREGGDGVKRKPRKREE